MSRVFVTVVIGAPTGKVWERIRDFNALPQWHPLIESSHIENDLPSATIGCIRNFQLKDNGGTIREQLLAMSDLDRFWTYSILESPIAVQNYVATLRLIEITQGDTTLGQWEAEFDVSGDEEETVELVKSVFHEGLINLDRLLSG